MDVAQDGAQVAASLAGSLDALVFRGLSTDEVTALVIDAVVAWAQQQGWRVYRRAPSVVPLPPPLDRQFSVLDVACARPDAPPVVVEVDHTDRRRTLDKLVAEAAAGRIAIWLRWGTGRFTAAPAPVHLVTFEVTRHPGAAGRGRLHSRAPGAEPPPPLHSGGGGHADAVELPFTGQGG